ncbi:MAG: DUF4112 domain-containing protein [Bacteroidota bacterium]|jgi:hypothetical protein|nr:DUF4112 domain-containing protein [Bacteroidota bacterium]
MIEDRREKARQELHLTTQKEGADLQKSIDKEQQRLQTKQAKRDELMNSGTFVLVRGLSKAMDTYMLDPIIGFLLPGIGDIIVAVTAFPVLYLSIFKIRSLPLTLAIIHNHLIDMFIGLIPFQIGNILDVFVRAHKKNLKLVVGYVDDDKEIINKVNKKAVWTAILIVVFISLIYLTFKFIEKLCDFVLSWF